MSKPLKALRWPAILVVTFMACTAGSAPVFTTGLILHEAVSQPLTLLVMGLLAALTASWMSNLLSGASTHSRILRIVAATENVAVLLIPSRDLFYMLRIGPNAVLLATWGAVLSLAACLAAWRFRSPTYRRRRDITISLILLAAVPPFVVATIAVASLFGLTGA